MERKAGNIHRLTVGSDTQQSDIIITVTSRQHRRLTEILNTGFVIGTVYGQCRYICIICSAHGDLVSYVTHNQVIPHSVRTGFDTYFFIRLCRLLLRTGSIGHGVQRPTQVGSSIVPARSVALSAFRSSYIHDIQARQIHRILILEHTDIYFLNHWLTVRSCRTGITGSSTFHI